MPEANSTSNAPHCSAPLRLAFVVWLCARSLRPDAPDGALEHLAYFALDIIECAARRQWPSIPQAQRDAAKAALHNLLQPGGSTLPVTVPLHVTGKATGAVVEIALREWPDEDVSFLSRWLDSADSAFAAAQASAGHPSMDAFRATRQCLTVIGSFLREASLATAPSSQAGSGALRLRTAFLSSGRAAALCRGLKVQGLGAVRRLLAIAKAAAAVASPSSPSHSAAALQTLGSRAVDAVSEVLGSGAVRIDASSMEALFSLSDCSIALVARSAPAALARARCDPAFVASLGPAVESLKSAPASLLPHAASALAAAIAAAWHEAAAEEVEEALEASDAASLLAEPAAAALAAVAASSQVQAAASISARLRASLAALSSTVPCAPSAELVAALGGIAAHAPAAGGTIPALPSAPAASAAATTAPAAAQAGYSGLGGGPAGTSAASLVSASLAPVARASVDVPVWFGCPDTAAESITDIVASLFQRHATPLVAALPVPGDGMPGAGGSASLLAALFTATTGCGDARQAAALLPVWAALSRAAAGAMGEDARPRAAALGAGATSVSLTLLRASLFCPALFDPAESGAAGAGVTAWPCLGLGPWGQPDSGGRGAGDSASRACAAGGGASVWSDDSITRGEAAASREPADDVSCASSISAEVSPIHALLNGSASPGEHASSAGCSWICSSAGSAGTTEYERFSLGVVSLCGMSAAAFSECSAALLGGLPGALGRAASVAFAALGDSALLAGRARAEGLGAGALVARAASGRPAARDCAALLRCSAALLDSVTWRSANVAGAALTAGIAAACDAIGATAASVAAACSERRAFSHGYAWLDLHRASLSALRSHAHLRAAAAAPVAFPLLAACRAALDGRIAPPPASLVAAAVAALSDTLANPSLRAAAASDGSLAALAGEAASLTASLGVEAKAQVIGVLAAAVAAQAAAAPAAAAGPPGALGPSAETLLAALVTPHAEICTAAAAAAAALGSDADGVSRSLCVVHRARIAGAAAVLSALAACSEHLASDEARSALYRLSAPALPALTTIVTGALLPTRFSAKASAAAACGAVLKASSVSLVATCLSCLARCLSAYSRQCGVAASFAVVGGVRDAFNGAVASGALALPIGSEAPSSDSPAEAAAPQGAPSAGFLRGSAAKTAAAAAAAVAAAAHGANPAAASALRWHLRLLRAVLCRAEAVRANGSAAMALMTDMTTTLAGSALGASAAAAGLAVVPLLAGQAEMLLAHWGSLTRRAPAAAAAGAAGAAPALGTVSFVSEAASAVVLRCLAAAHTTMVRPGSEPRDVRCAIRCLARVQSAHKVLGMPGVVASGAAEACLTAAAGIALLGSQPSCEADAAEFLRDEALRDPDMAAFLAERVIPGVAAAAAGVPAGSSQAAAATKAIGAVLLDPAGGSQGLVERMLAAFG